VDDGLNEWRRQELLWSLRWLAADPEAALAAVPGVVTADEIALDLEHWTEVAKGWGLVSGTVEALLDEIDREFAAMTEADRPDLWTDDAIALSPEWGEQRRRARELLRELGEERADHQLGAARPGGPVYVFQKSRGPR
jgi:hypothetical protein